MDDINFDELDKAVNSALKQNAKPALSVDTAMVNSSEAPAVPAEAREEPTPAVKPVERVASKRRGQFMDMVHPSSDMIKQAPARTSRQAVTIQPLNPSVVEEQQDDAKQETPNQDAVVPPEAPAKSAVAAVSETEEPPKSEWPDPLDAMEQQESAAAPREEPTPSPESGVSVTATPPEDTTATVEKEADSSAEQQESSGSPFISGTEPEKRPLGAFADQAPSDKVSEADEVAADENTSKAEDGTGNELPAVPQVPQELTPEVVSVESDDPSRMSSNEDMPDDSTPNEGAGMAASISQQYKNTDEPSDGQDHPVFDTKDYHQPLTPPAKHGHTGLVVALIIILLTLLGAGAWYAIFVLKVI